MALSRFCVGLGLFLSLPAATFASSLPQEEAGQILYWAHKGGTVAAWERYLAWAAGQPTHDFAFLQQLALQLLEQGARSQDPESELLCMFGAGVSTSPQLLPILEQGVSSQAPQIQLVALHYAGRLQDDRTQHLLTRALQSPFIITRLQACLLLAQKSDPTALQQLRSLMVKVPPEARSVFAQIGVLIDHPEAEAFLRQLLQDPTADVRLETLGQLARAGRDDFLPLIRSLATHTHYALQEGCAYALALLNDPLAPPLLTTFTQSPHENVRLAGHWALAKLGKRTALEVLEQQALLGNLFAINALGDLKEGEASLCTLLKHPQRDVRLNALLALLDMHVPMPAVHLKEFLACGLQDVGFYPIRSGGKIFKAWKCIPSASQQGKTYPDLAAHTLQLKERLVVGALEFAEEPFLQLSRWILQEKIVDVLPLLMAALQSRPSENVRALLREGQQQTGAPLVRMYCTLALYKLHPEPLLEHILVQWVERSAHRDMIRFQKAASSQITEDLRPEEASGLLIAIFETLASSHQRVGMDALIRAIVYGNTKNRYALAGLLLRMAE